MRYDGPIYRPPSEADSLLVQATVGCPHNLCTFCMVYKDGVKFKVRPVSEIKADLIEAAATHGSRVRTLFFPAGNTIAMPVAALAAICRYSYALFPRLERITVYGSSQYIHRKGPDQLQTLAQAGLGRIHVGVESGDDVILTRIKKGAAAQTTSGRAKSPGPRALRSTLTSWSGSAARSAPRPTPGRPPGSSAPCSRPWCGSGPSSPRSTPLAGRRPGRAVSDAQPAPGAHGNHDSPVGDHDTDAGYQRPLHQLSRHQWPAARGPGRHARGATPGLGSGRIHLPPVLYRYAVRLRGESGESDPKSLGGTGILPVRVHRLKTCATKV